MRYIGYNQRKRDRSNIVKGIFAIALSIGIAYYSFLGFKCYNHFSELVNNRVALIDYSFKK
jgi:hypothetical protein